MTIDEFRKLALSMPEATEGQHGGHPDFRVNNKVFASLGVPDEDWGMVKLKPAQQAIFVGSEPQMFKPVKGSWGLKGATNVCLKPARHASVRQALIEAWKNTAPKKLVEKYEEI